MFGFDVADALFVGGRYVFQALDGVEDDLEIVGDDLKLMGDDLEVMGDAVKALFVFALRCRGMLFVVAV